VFLRYPKRAYTFSVDYFSTPESVDPYFSSKQKPRLRFVDAVGAFFFTFSSPRFTTSMQVMPINPQPYLASIIRAVLPVRYC
ncbi:hypothetical protein, partial [Lacticaseibacillus paracasei]|uniref:hypothetical protein n=1 Tax=Lacticaseibacillus paracasei TaxID=1597 RepID=UPI001CDB7A07